ncbi:hypothetical protein KGF57_003396 [Candida theae]|uniref:THUMP domain-containing protein n=1 Tax=Candida theae TaxID=1198502 RepID=A0AAD5BDY9_9ASCO|nr:uncharacterized protein KGF57_003396 [Candida theae]KAI5957022.1 hypothetical protein KGF57_003396 [Candida theae]
MSKRKSEHYSKSKGKRFKSGSNLLGPHTAGIYATCPRGKEKQCRRELISVLSEKISKYFDISKEGDEDSENKRPDSLSIEEKIQQELSEMKEANDNPQASYLQPLDIDVECVVFIETKMPIDPVLLVHEYAKECFTSGVKTTRSTQKLTPISDSCSATGDVEEHLKELSRHVLKDHFHKDGQDPVKFAIQVSRKHFDTLTSEAIIKSVAETVGREHGHTVDLKNYEKLIIVECYKNNIGMSVVEDYLKFSKFNLQQIYDKTVN